MALNIAFAGVAIMFLLLGFDAYTKAQKIPRSTEEEMRQFKKMSNRGISFIFSGITFGILAAMRQFIL